MAAPKTKGAYVARWLRFLTSDLKLKMTDARRYQPLVLRFAAIYPQTGV
jgi:hypothetical protein